MSGQGTVTNGSSGGGYSSSPDGPQTYMGTFRMQAAAATSPTSESPQKSGRPQTEHNNNHNNMVNNNNNNNNGQVNAVGDYGKSFFKG